MAMKTKVSSNLLIAGSELASSEHKEDSLFKAALQQEKNAWLEPVSTVDGINFFYTIDAKADGSKEHAITGDGAVPYKEYNPATAATDTTNYLNKFSEDYGVTKTEAGATYSNGAVGYVDYIFELKATNVSGDDQEIDITKLDLEYQDAAETADLTKAFRVGVFAEDVTTGTAAGATTLVGIYQPSAAGYFDSKGVSGVDSTAAIDGVLASATTNVAVVPANTTKYFKVVVRLWIEGADTTCNNDTFAKLSDTWKLNLDLSLVAENSNGVANLTVKKKTA